MSRLDDEHAGHARRALAYERLYLPAEAPVIVANNDALYDFAADTIGKEQPVTYLEFGVAGGGSFLQDAPALHQSRRAVHRI